MAHTLSAKKRIRQSEKRNEANRQVKSSIRTEEKKIRKLVEEKKYPEAQEALKSYFSKIDKAGKNNTIHKTTVSRKKSRLNIFVKKASGDVRAQSS